MIDSDRYQILLFGVLVALLSLGCALLNRRLAIIVLGALTVLAVVGAVLLFTKP